MTLSMKKTLVATGLPTVQIQLPPAGFAIYHASPALHRFGPRPPEDLKQWREDAWHGGIPATDQEPV